MTSKSLKPWVSGVAVCVALANAPAMAAPITFTVLPDTIEGAPGSTIGWGYSLTNSSLTDWLVATAVNGDAFDHGTPVPLFDFPLVPPGTTIAIPYDAASPLGLYELTWDVDAPAGHVSAGTFVLEAEWWDGDPWDAGGAASFLDAGQASASYSARVITEATVAEPSTLALSLVAGGAWLWRTGARSSRRSKKRLAI